MPATTPVAIPNAMLERVDAQRAYVRELARTLAARAAGPENAACRQRWRDVNELRKPDRWPVWCNPVGAWKEILPESDLRCTDPWLRGYERQFRRLLWKLTLGQDEPLPDFIGVPAVLRADPPNLWGVEIERVAATEEGGAWGYDPPLRTEADFDRLRSPVFVHDAEATREALERTGELFDGIFPVRRTGGMPISPTWTQLSDLRGLEQIMVDMIEAPELVHRLMAHLRDATLAAMDVVEREGLVTPNTHGPMLESDPFGPAPVDGRYTFAHTWCYVNSQEFDQVSPAMWEEFCLAYQKEVAVRCGRTCYGCCENLTHKAAGVLSIPNLRIFVCSGWSDLDTIVDAVGSDYTLMWREKASDVVFVDDTATIANKLDAAFRRMRGCSVQVILRELETLAGHPDRLHEWVALAKEAAARYA